MKINKTSRISPIQKTTNIKKSRYDTFENVFQAELDKKKQDRQNEDNEESRKDSKTCKPYSNKGLDENSDINEIKEKIEGENMGQLYSLLHTLQKKSPEEAFKYLEKLRKKDKERAEQLSTRNTPKGEER